LKPLERARKLGDSLKLPLLVHVGESWTKDTAPVHVGNVLKYLRPGDIVTHMFTVHPGGLLDGNGKLWPQVRDAKESGGLMDVGHGLHNLNFDVARKVLDQGLHPDGVSTDGHRGNRAGPVYDLPTTMAKLMALGFTLNQVVEMATVNAARLLGRLSQLGSLRIGEPADISVLRVEDREWKAVDTAAAIPLLAGCLVARSRRVQSPARHEPVATGTSTRPTSTYPKRALAAGSPRTGSHQSNRNTDAQLNTAPHKPKTEANESASAIRGQVRAPNSISRNHSVRLTFDMNGRARLGGTCPLDGGVRRLVQ
jgi:predicted amidohydrolase